MLHSKPGSFVNGEPLFSRFLFSNLIAEPVSTFLLITGFFFDGSSGYLKTVGKNVKRILIPLLTYTLFIIWYSKGFASPQRTKDSLLSLGRCLVTWNPEIHNTGHLWYLYVHMLVIAASPLIISLVRKIKEKTAYEIRTLVLILGAFLANDLLGNRLFRCTQVPISSFVPAVLIVVTGSIIYHLFQKYPSMRIAGIISPALFVALNLYRSRIQFSAGSQAAVSQFSFPGVMCAVLACMFVLALPSFENGLSKAINYISSLTLVVYIWHVIVIELTVTTGLKLGFAKLITDGSETLAMYLRFTILYALLIFFMCALLAILFRTANRLILMLFQKRGKER